MTLFVEISLAIMTLGIVTLGIVLAVLVKDQRRSNNTMLTIINVCKNLTDAIEVLQAENIKNEEFKVSVAQFIMAVEEIITQPPAKTQAKPVRALKVDKKKLN